jgi:hypothetical protein
MILGDTAGTSTRTFMGLWSKYRPVILKMMIDADEEAQNYQLSGHEFQAFSGLKKGVYSFNLQVDQGRVVSGLKDSSVAQGLWEILQMSRKASELISKSGYHFSMDRTFVLLIRKETDKK